MVWGLGMTTRREPEDSLLKATLMVNSPTYKQCSVCRIVVVRKSREINLPRLRACQGWYRRMKMHGLAMVVQQDIK